MCASGFSDFTVHVFVNHDPFIASVLLPDLFSEFPESAWRLPQEIATPRRPEVPPNPIPESVVRQLMTRPRRGLGRLVFHDVVPYSTTLRELSLSLEQEFGLNRKLLAQFTIFPQGYQDDGTLPKWHNKPLPWDMTLGEVAPLDLDAVAGGQYAGIADQFSPVLHIVIETKAAALQRSLGGVIEEKFQAQTLQETYKHRRDMWNLLAAFINAFPTRPYPNITGALQRWRSAFYSHRYLEGERAKLIVQEHVDKDDLQGVTRGLEKYQVQKMEEKFSISAMADDWEKWVLKQDYSHHDPNRNQELQDDEVENKVISILRQRAMVVEWGKSEKKQPLLDILRGSDSRSGEDLISKRRQQPYPILPEKSEEQRQFVSKGERADKPHESLCPDACSVNTLPFRLADGTLNHELAKFTITSGIISWGPILPIYHGLLQGNLTNNAAETLTPLSGGTILQHAYTYKSAARIGDWKVRQYYGNVSPETIFDPDGEKIHAGWIVCHEDIDPWDIVQRVRALGSKFGPGAISNRNEHTDKDVLYIGRYDWGFPWSELEDKFCDWAKTIVEAYKSKEVRSFPEEGVEGGQTQDEILAERRDIALELLHRLKRVLLNRKRPPQDSEMPLVAEYLHQLEQLPDSDTRVFSNAYMINTLMELSDLKSNPRDDEFGITERVCALDEKWRRLLRVKPVSKPVSDRWYYALPSTSIAGVSQAGYFIAMDSEDFDLDFVDAQERIEEGSRYMQEVTFRKGARRFGAYVAFPRESGDEYAWLVFSGKRQAQHDADELIAIIYDGTGEVFQSLYHAVEPEIYLTEV